jgi:uncharacterized 2Fe-2S/4Fe-4S cluster protein (DUF4445 family)
MADIVINPIGSRIRTKKGTTLLQAIRKSGLELTAHCNGLGRCGRCRVQITSGPAAINQPTEAELKHLTPQELSGGIRLACQVPARGKVEINIPDESIIRRVRLQTEGLETEVQLAPLVRKIPLELSKPSLQSLQPDLERVLGDLLRHNTRPGLIPLKTLSDLPQVLRSANWKVTATVWDNREILDVEKGNTSAVCYGLAVDIGTTKLACSLVNLATGDTEATSAMVNPQILYGEDILARIAYVMRNESGRRDIQKEVIEGINHLTAECCSKHKVSSRNIYEATMVANTAMHHLLLGIFPDHLALSPYIPAVKGALNIKAGELGLNINADANIHFLPVIAGFVGSDCVADVLATGLFGEKDNCLLLDIGTNTEVVIGNRNRMLSCSCASGPAFEGGHLKHGMQAMSGAIEKVALEPGSLKVSFSTVDNDLAKGICGSGILDCIAEMLKAGVINTKGLIQRDPWLPGVRKNKDGETEFVIVPAGKATRDIVVTQGDIGTIQLAKGAIYAGILILMQEMKIKPGELKHVYIAGAFGSHINPINARAIGLLPDVPLQTIRSVGNTALTGAKMALVSKKARRTCEKISDKVEYIELAAHPDFHSVFIESLRFPEPLQS